MPDILPAGLPIQLSAAEAGWIGLGAAIIEVKAALDAAVSEAKGTWTGEAADAFSEWWDSRSAPMLELGAACEAVAATIVAAIAETTAANVVWEAAAAAAAMAPEVPTMGIAVWEGGMPAIEPFLVGAFAPAVADPFTAIAAAAELAECTAAATTTFVLVTASIATTAAAVTAVGALATGLVGALVLGVDGNVPQASALDTAMNVGLPMAGGVVGAGLAARSGLKTLRGAEDAAKAAEAAPIAFKGRAGQLSEDVSAGSKARVASDAESEAANVDSAAIGGARARTASDAGDRESALTDVGTPSGRARRAEDAGDTGSNLGDAQTRSGRAREASHAGDTRSQLGDADTPTTRSRGAEDAGTHTRSRGLTDAEGAALAGGGLAGAAAAISKKRARAKLTEAGLAGKPGENLIGGDASLLGKLGLRGNLGKKLGAVQSAASANLKSNRRFLDPDHLKAINELSDSAAGRDALRRRGFFTRQDLDQFATKGEWKNWEKLTPQKRLQLATHASQHPEEFANTPAGFKALSIQAKNGDASALARIYERDADQWGKAMQHDPARPAGEAANAGVLKRLFGVLQSGELKHSDAAAPGGFTHWDKHVPVAAALSHGGRVEIRIPALKPGEDPDAFFRHIFGDDGGKTAGLFTRPAGTHYVEIGPNTAGGAGKFEEQLGNGAALKSALDKDWKHYGLDVPVGGTGNVDGAGNRISADGKHGHLYIGYKPPSEGRDGVLLVGAETERPGETNVLGNKHDIRAKSAEMGPAMTDKSDRIGANANGRIVDLNDLARDNPDWMNQLKTDTDRLSPKHLAGSHVKVPPRKPARPH